MTFWTGTPMLLCAFRVSLRYGNYECYWNTSWWKENRAVCAVAVQGFVLSLLCPTPEVNHILTLLAWANWSKAWMKVIVWPRLIYYMFRHISHGASRCHAAQSWRKSGSGHNTRFRTFNLLTAFEQILWGLRYRHMVSKVFRHGQFHPTRPWSTRSNCWRSTEAPSRVWPYRFPWTLYFVLFLTLHATQVCLCSLCYL